MKITRDVIYDLLPGYFANEVSADTRTLIEEFFAADAEFGRMAARFATLLNERPDRAQQASDAAREREVFERARAAAELPLRVRTGSVAWALAAAFSWLIAFLTWNERMGLLNPGVILGTVFLLTAIVWFVASFRITPDSRWRVLLGMDAQTLRSVGPWKRQ